MNGSKKWGFVWWATGNNAGRSTCAFLIDAGCDDLYAYSEEGEVLYIEYKDGGKTPVWRNHAQGVPKGFEEYPVISNTRNPYDRAYWQVQTQNQQIYEKEGREMSDGERRSSLKAIVEEERGNDDSFWKQFPLLNVYPNHYIRVESLEEDIKSIDCIMNNADPVKVEESFKANIRTNFFKESEVKIYAGLTHFQEYRENGNRLWEHFYDQELADLVYENWGDAFTMMGYDRDSWKL
jgi:hypothetical protein